MKIGDDFTVFLFDSENILLCLFVLSDFLAELNGIWAVLGFGVLFGIAILVWIFLYELFLKVVITKACRDLFNLALLSVVLVSPSKRGSYFIFIALVLSAQQAGSSPLELVHGVGLHVSLPVRASRASIWSCQRSAIPTFPSPRFHKRMTNVFR